MVASIKDKCFNSIRHERGERARCLDFIVQKTTKQVASTKERAARQITEMNTKLKTKESIMCS